MIQRGDYSDAPFTAMLYDLVPAYINRGDLDFYTGYARESSGPVLELGCGTGRVLIPIACEGIQITGLDLSEFMLTKCREKLEKEPPEIRQNAETVMGDMRTFDLEKTFGLATSPFRAFQHLITLEDQISCITCIYNHLQPGGKFILDIFNPDLKRIASLPSGKEIEDLPEVTIADGRKLRRAARVPKINRPEQYMDVELIYYVTSVNGQTERYVHAFNMRYLFRYEVEHLLARCGFRIVELFGNYDKSSLADNSPEMIFIAEKPGY